MVSRTASLVATVLSLGSLDLVVARGQINARELTPRYSLPKQLKRQINYRASTPVPESSDVASSSGLGNWLESLLNLEPETTPSATNEGTEVVIVPITLSVDVHGATHTITGEPQTTTTNGPSAGSTSTTTKTAATVSATTTEEPTTTTTSSPTKTSSTETTTTTAAPTMLGETIDDIWASLFGGSGSTSTTASPTETPTSSESAQSTSTETETSSTTGSAANTTSTDATVSPSSSSTGGLLDDLLPTNLLPTISVDVPTVTPSASSSSIDVIGSLTSSLGLGSESLTLPTSTLSILPTSLSSVLFPPSSETGSSSTPIIAPTASSSSVVPSSSSSGLITSSSVSHQPTSQATPTSIPTTSTSTTITTTTTETVPEPTSVPTEEPAEPTNFVPSSILVEPSPTAEDTATEETTTVAPTQLPGSISPAGGPPDVPEGSTLIQLGFNRELRYSFVATHSLSSSQIFLYIPEGLIYALETISKNIAMFSIQPYDNSASTGYIATVAQAYVPSDKVETLRKLLHNPISRLYDQPNGSVRTLMSMIDPSIPLVVGEYGSSDYGNGLTNSGNYDDSNPNDHTTNPSGDDTVAGASSSSSTKPSSVGIGVGVVAGAVAYGAGMFWVARRYRKKRQLHKRSSSTVEQMSEGPGAGAVFAAGGLSRGQSSRGSQRTQMISAPVMAENSLGWN